MLEGSVWRAALLFCHKKGALACFLYGRVIQWEKGQWKKSRESGVSLKNGKDNSDWGTGFCQDGGTAVFLRG